jgi:hypothetical protein
VNTTERLSVLGEVDGQRFSASSMKKGDVRLMCKNKIRGQFFWTHE